MDKPLRWMGQTRKILRSMPDDVKDEVGHSLHVAQQGGSAVNAKEGGPFSL